MVFQNIKKMRDLELDDQDNQESDSVSDSDESDNAASDLLFVQTDRHATSLVNTKEYILSLSATREAEPTVAVGLTNNTCEIYKLSNGQLAHSSSLNHCNNEDKIMDCRFSSIDNNLLYTGTADSIYLWDLRTQGKAIVSFPGNENSACEGKTFTCFDVSPNNRLLSVGTNVFGGDAFILFWDIRNTKLLGGYWESHVDDITQVKFHPNDMNRMISGSVDGYINIYDLTQTSEDDALVDTLNTESSVEKLSFFVENSKDSISCITHTVDLQLWKMDDVAPYLHLKRNDLAGILQEKSEGSVYIGNLHHTIDSQFLLFGSTHKRKSRCRTAKICGKTASPLHGFRDNDQRVRCSSFDENTNLLLTGGENGVLDVWQLQKQISL